MQSEIQRTRIILLNGTSSAGKTTLAHALRPALDASFCYYASDMLADAGFRPTEPKTRQTQRESFFHGFHYSIAAFAGAGNDLLVEHIVEEQSWAYELTELLQPFDVFWVGVHAPMEQIESRERERGNRMHGEGRFHLKTHGFCTYDCEVDTSFPLTDVVQQIVKAWRGRDVRPHQAAAPA